MTAGESGDITEAALPLNAAEEALAEATDAAAEGAAFDFGTD